MPFGYKTLDGNRPDIAAAYNMLEHGSGNYADRTEANVKDSDGTLMIAKRFTSAGERCTMKAINKHYKHHCAVRFESLDKSELLSDVRAWIEGNEIKVLNVAGNSEVTAPGIGDRAYRFLLCLFHDVIKAR